MQLDLLLAENRRLQRCINDLASLMALPAVWAGREPSQVAGSLLDSLLGMLDLEFAHFHLNDASAGVPLEVTRLSRWASSVAPPEGFGVLLASWMTGDGQEGLRRHTVADSVLAVLPMRLGLLGEIGLLMVGSRRPDFPAQADGLLLSVAANQAVIGLQATWQLSGPKRLARELDQRDEARTRELADANAELQRRKLDFQLVVDSIPVPVAVTTPIGEVEGLNRPTMEYFGKNIDELKAWKSSDVVHPDDLELTIDTNRAAHEAGRVYNVQSRLRRIDGVYRWFNIVGVPLRDPGGQILRWFHLIIDIDDQKRAEEALAESDRYFAQIVNTLPGLAWSALTDGNADFFNQHYLDYVGLTTAEARGSGWAKAVHPDDLQCLLAIWHDMLASGQAHEAVARLRRFDGEYRWFLFRTNPLHDDTGRVVRWFGVNTDIEDRIRAEEALRASEWNLRRLTETIPQMLWSATPDGASDYCNARLLDFTGFTASEVVGDGWKRLFHPDDLDYVARAWSTSVATGASYKVEARLACAADQSYRWCLTTGLPLRDEEGRVLKWHGVCVDMHDWKEAQDELRETQAELAHITRVMTMGQLAASIAHELNQPLAGITTNAGTGLRMLTAEPPNLEGARETARRTIRDAKRASEVLVRLRALFSKRTTVSEVVDLNAAAQEVIALSSSELQKNGVSFRVNLADNLPRVLGDRVQLQQVILNFIQNGVEAMEGVSDRPKELLLSTEPEGSGHVKFAVRDAGVGFDPAVTNKLFSPFYTTKNNGMGIGLSVSRTIIENHHGRLWAECNDGPGSTFCFSVPSRPRAEPAEVSVGGPARGSADATGNA